MIGDEAYMLLIQDEAIVWIEVQTDWVHSVSVDRLLARCVSRIQILHLQAHGGRCMS